MMKGFRPGKGEEMIAKKIQEEAEEKRQDFKQRQDLFVKSIEDLSLQYQISIVPVLDYKRDGCYPMIAFIDDKQKEVKKEEKPSEEPKVKLELH